MRLPGDDAIATAEAKMAAIFKVIGEQQSHELKIKAIVALSAMWASIEEDLKAAIAVREGLVETDDLATLTALASHKLEAVVKTYQMASTRFLGKLLLQAERDAAKGNEQ
jgi:hypothetical protein